MGQRRRVASNLIQLGELELGGFEGYVMETGDSEKGYDKSVIIHIPNVSLVDIVAYEEEEED